MQKTATPQEVRNEILKLVAYTEKNLPSRQRLAAEMRDLADRVAGDNWPDEKDLYERLGSKRLQQEIEKIIRGTGGKVLLAQMYEPAKGGGWTVLLDSEYAALKVYYVYRKSDVRLNKNPKGWAVSVS